MTRRRDKRDLPGRLVSFSSSRSLKTSGNRAFVFGAPRLQNVPQVYLLLNRNLRHYILGKPLIYLVQFWVVFIHCNIVFL